MLHVSLRFYAFLNLVQISKQVPNLLVLRKTFFEKKNEKCKADIKFFLVGGWRCWKPTTEAHEKFGTYHVKIMIKVPM